MTRIIILVLFISSSTWAEDAISPEGLNVFFPMRGRPGARVTDTMSDYYLLSNGESRYDENKWKVVGGPYGKKLVKQFTSPYMDQALKLTYDDQEGKKQLSEVIFASTSDDREFYSEFEGGKLKALTLPAYFGRQYPMTVTAQGCIEFLNLPAFKGKSQSQRESALNQCGEVFQGGAILVGAFLKYVNSDHIKKLDAFVQQSGISKPHRSVVEPVSKADRDKGLERLLQESGNLSQWARLILNLCSSLAPKANETAASPTPTRIKTVKPAHSVPRMDGK